MLVKNCYKHPEGEAFEFEFKSKFIVLMGKNGAGKTTMMNAIEQELDHKDNIIVLNDDARNRGDTMSNVFDPQHIMSTRFSSEGESLIHTFGAMFQKVGYHVKQKDRIILCLDKVDSGLSYDRIKEVVEFLEEFMVKEVEHIVISANSYELASLLKDKAEFYWVETNEYFELGSWDEFVKRYV